MTSTPDSPPHNGDDLAQLRAEIDELKSHTTEELIDPTFGDLEGKQLDAGPTEAPGSAFETDAYRKRQHEKDERRSHEGS
ncbi:hypothetical protein ACPW96_09480 [Micromonospora sp. DT81.3]|uniref:hypothetical protein n=1 Tax=Actinomycetes TaxID=1760 RepID=UPI003CE883E5